MGWIGGIRCKKNPIRIRGTNFCINCSISARFPPSFVRQRNGPKSTKQYVTYQNMNLGSNGLIGSVSCEKFRHNFVARTFALIAPFHPVLHRVSQGNKTVPNASKQYETYKNMSLGSNGVDMEHSL